MEKKMDAYTCYKAMQQILHSHQWMESGDLARSWPNTATVSDVYYILWMPIAAREWKHVYKNNSPTIFNNQTR